MPKAQKHCKLQCFGFWHPMKNVRKQPKVSKLELLFQASKNGGAAAHFWSSPQPGSGLTFPNGPESEPPPYTPQISFASLIPILSPGLRLAFVISHYHNLLFANWIPYALLLINHGDTYPKSSRLPGQATTHFTSWKSKCNCRESIKASLFTSNNAGRVERRFNMPVVLLAKNKHWQLSATPAMSSRTV